MKWIVQVLVLGAFVLSGCSDRPGDREFHQALAQLERGRPVRARDLFERSIQRRPGHEKNAYALQHLGVIAWQLGDTAAAGIYFERSRTKNPTLFEPVFSLGALAFESGDWVLARSLFQSAAQLQPRDPRPWEYLAATHPGPAGVREARRALLEAESRDPHSPRILTALAVVEMESGQPTRAISNLMRALEEDPAYAPALYNLAKIHATIPDQRRNAIAYYQQFLNVSVPGEQMEQAGRELVLLQREVARAGAPTVPDVPDDPPVAPPPPVADPEPPPPPTLDDQIAEAAALARQGQAERALALFTRLAARQRQEGNRDEAERVLRAGVEALPETGVLYVELGRLYMDEGRHGAAVRVFQRAIHVDGEWAQPLILLAESAQALEQYDTAIDALVRAVPLARNDPSPLWALAELYDHVGIPRRAADTYQQFVERFPRDTRSVQARERVQQLRPPVVAPPQPVPSREPPPVSPEEAQRRRNAREALRLGIAQQRRGDLNGALFYFTRAAAHDPTLERAHFNIGLIELQQGNWVLARDALSQAVAIETGIPQSWYLLAYAQNQLGESRRAITSLETALRLNPDYELAYLLLGNIYSDDTATRPQAVRAYQRFLEIAPEHDQAEAVRQWLARNP